MVMISYSNSIGVIQKINNMEEGDFRQDFFISEDGYINIKLKVTTDDKVEREKLIGQLMGSMGNGNDMDISKYAQVSQIYFKGHNPLSALEDLKKTMLTDMESYMDNIINQHKT